MKVDIFSTDRKYRVIYADPPWKYSSKEAMGKKFVPLEKVYQTEKTASMC